MYVLGIIMRHPNIVECFSKILFNVIIAPIFSFKNICQVGDNDLPRGFPTHYKYHLLCPI